MVQRLDRIERIGETVPVGGARHKLRNPLGTLGAHGAGIETQFWPDNASKKLNGVARSPLPLAPMCGKRRRLWVVARTKSPVRLARPAE